MYQGNLLYNHCGDDSVEDPPVLIPNTEVKLNCAESTWLATAWEDKESPHSIFKDLSYNEKGLLLFLIIYNTPLTESFLSMCNHLI